MNTLIELLTKAEHGLSDLKNEIGNYLKKEPETSIPEGCSYYGFYLPREKLTAPFNDIDAQGIYFVIHDPEKEITCYPIRRDGGEKIYAVSFDFSGCFMALFEQDGTLYAAHITTSSDGSIDGRVAFQRIIGKEGTPYIVYKPSEGMCDTTAGMVEFTNFDHFQCYSFGQNKHCLAEKKIRKNDASVLTKSTSQDKQCGCGCVIL